MDPADSDPRLPAEPIAAGRVAQIYAWGDGRVVKLARDWVPADWVDYEFRISRIVHGSGLRISVRISGAPRTGGPSSNRGCSRSCSPGSPRASNRSGMLPCAG